MFVLMVGRACRGVEVGGEGWVGDLGREVGRWVVLGGRDADAVYIRAQIHDRRLIPLHFT